MGISVWQILIIVVLLVLLFGRGKISQLMGDVAQGIKSFKRGMREEQAEPAAAEKIEMADKQPAEPAAKDAVDANRT